jgi:uncharacterized protein YoxC
MPMIVQICVVIVTMTIVALAVATILAMVRLGKAAARLTAAAQVSVTQVELVVLETRELLASARLIAAPAQNVVRRFQRIGERAADLSTAVLDEIEQPVVTAVAVARGVKSGAATLLQLMTRRFVSKSSSHNGDENNE